MRKGNKCEAITQVKSFEEFHKYGIKPSISMVRKRKVEEEQSLQRKQSTNHINSDPSNFKVE